MAARCSGCGSQLAANSRFCSLCGKEATPAVAATGYPRTPTGTPVSGGAYTPPGSGGMGNRKVAIAATGGAIAVALALFLLLRAAGVLGAKGTETPSAAVLTAPQTQPVAAPVLNAPAAAPSAAPMLSAPDRKDIPMPEDVIAYLRWLKKFEAARRSLANRQEAKLTLILTNMIKGGLQTALDFENGNDEIKPISNEDLATISSMIQEWNQATGTFQKVTPPNPCVTLATSYNGMLASIVSAQTSTLQKFHSTLQSLSASGGNKDANTTNVLQDLQNEKNGGQLTGTVEGSIGDADSALDTLRNQYTSMPEDIDKRHFTIHDESGVAVPKVPGLPGF